MTTTTAPTAVNLETLAGALARELGPGWRVHEPDTWRCTLLGPDQARVWLGLRDGRLNVSPTWPASASGQTGRHYDHGPREVEQRPEATMSAHRPPAILAREIQRRVLGPYLAELPAALQRQAEERDRIAEIARVAQTVARVLGHTWRERDREEIVRNSTAKLYSSVDTILTASVGYDATVSLELRHVPLARALAIIAQLREDQAREEEAPA